VFPKEIGERDGGIKDAYLLVKYEYSDGGGEYTGREEGW
jgi:hypothetical protein